MSVTPPSTGPTEAVRLVQDAIKDKTVRHGRHVADLLREHGHTEAADRISKEVSTRHGHLSVWQAAELLEQTAPAGDA